MSPLGDPGSYSVQETPARRVIDITEEELEVFGRAADDVLGRLESAGSAAGAGSMVAGALARFGEAATTRTAQDCRRRVEQAAARARDAIDAYVASHLEMAEQYGPYAVELPPPLVLSDPSTWGLPHPDPFGPLLPVDPPAPPEAPR